MKNSKNDAVSYIMMRAQTNVIGTLGKNHAYLKISPAVGPAHPASRMQDVDMDAKIAHIHELIRMRDGLEQLDVLSQDELQDILQWLCTS